MSRFNLEVTCLDVQRRASFGIEIGGSCLRRSFGLRFRRRFPIGGDGGFACGNTRLFGGRFRHVETVSVMCGSRFSLGLGFCWPVGLFVLSFGFGLCSFGPVVIIAFLAFWVFLIYYDGKKKKIDAKEKKIDHSWY